MSDSKKFFELVAKDAAVKSELEKASFEALKTLIDAKGLKTEAQKAIEEATAKVAKAHGFNTAMDAIDEEELKAVAGGGYSCTGVVMKWTCENITW